MGTPMTTSRRSFDSRRTLIDLRDTALHEARSADNESGAFASGTRAAPARLALAAADEYFPTRRPNRQRRLLGRLGGPGGARLTVRRLR
jgi:hypothetical protein